MTSFMPPWRLVRRSRRPIREQPRSGAGHVAGSCASRATGAASRSTGSPTTSRAGRAAPWGPARRSADRTRRRPTPVGPGSVPARLRVGLLGVERGAVTVQRRRERPHEPFVVGMAEGEAREEDGARPVDGGRHGTTHIPLVAVALEVDAAEGKPHRRRAEHGARAPILLAPCACRLALGRKPAAPIPAPGGRGRVRIASEDGEELDRRSCAAPRGDRRSEREHAVVEVGRDHHDATRRRLGRLRGDHDAL